MRYFKKAYFMARTEAAVGTGDDQKKSEYEKEISELMQQHRAELNEISERVKKVIN